MASCLAWTSKTGHLSLSRAECLFQRRSNHTSCRCPYSVTRNFWGGAGRGARPFPCPLRFMSLPSLSVSFRPLEVAPQHPAKTLGGLLLSAPGGGNDTCSHQTRSLGSYTKNGGGREGGKRGEAERKKWGGRTHPRFPPIDLWLYTASFEYIYRWCGYILCNVVFGAGSAVLTLEPGTS